VIRRIISGGQTGADQAALDAAIDLGIPHGGWIPRNRITENGILPMKYQLQEMPTASYRKRTEKNVLDSDGTLILSHGKLKGGSALTQQRAKHHQRPCLHIDLDLRPASEAITEIQSWLGQHDIRVLNVAGPRASEDQRIYRETYQILRAVLQERR